jgi:hypothetical protein
LCISFSKPYCGEISLKLRFLVIFWLLAFVSTAHPQTKRPIYSIAGGIALPSQPWILKHYWDAGLHISGGAGCPLTRHLTTRAMFSYSHFPFDPEAVIKHDSYVAPWIRVDGYASKAITASLQLKFDFVSAAGTARFLPYMFGGPCWHYQIIGEYAEFFRPIPKFHQSEHWAEQKVSSLGLELGVGLEFRISSRLGVLIEAARSVGLSVEPSCGAGIPVRVGLSYR